jgi:hypothetical protein
MQLFFNTREPVHPEKTARFGFFAFGYNGFGRFRFFCSALEFFHLLSPPPHSTPTLILTIVPSYVFLFKFNYTGLADSVGRTMKKKHAPKLMA